MICIIALIVFAVLGIFSARYRKLAKEAFVCVYRKLTLRKCVSDLDNRMKLKVIFKTAKFSPKLAKGLQKYFSVFSWIFTILLFASIILTAQVGYNLAVYGSCDPHSDFCIFSPNELSCGSEDCEMRGCDCDSVGCEAPEFHACEGNCSCEETVCG